MACLQNIIFTATTEGWILHSPLTVRNRVGTRTWLPQSPNDDHAQPLHLDNNILNNNHTDAHSKKHLRLAKAQAEIDRILAAPDAPFDVENEMAKRVTSVITTPDEESTASDRAEADIYRAVAARDYAAAAAHKRTLDSLHLDQAGAVLQVNSAYYQALTAQEYERMQEVWLPDASVTCIHPGMEPLVGYKDVMENWREVFAVTPQRCRVEPENIRLVVRGGNTAVVTCEEHVYAKRPYIRGQSRPGAMEHINTLQTTHVFRKVEQKWYLTHHHASWHAKSRIGRLALEQASRPNSSPPDIVKDAGSNSPSPMDGMMGITNYSQPIIRDERNSNRGGGGGGLEDFVENTLKDFLSKDGTGGNSGKLPFIQIHRIDNNSKSSANSDGWSMVNNGPLDDEDEDDEEDDDNDDDSSSTNVIRRQFTITPNTVWSTVNNDKSSSSSDPKVQQRQNCISVLRDLAAAGTLSRLHKRVLLSDIITCVARKEQSLVEVAYELLYDDGEGETCWEEDFAEQCRAFAEELLEEG